MLKSDPVFAGMIKGAKSLIKSKSISDAIKSLINIGVVYKG